MRLFFIIPFLLFSLIKPLSTKPGLEEITFEETTLGCSVSGGSSFFINSQDELKKFWKEHANCYRFVMPKIDFEKYSLLGIQSDATGCGFPKVTETIVKDNFTNIYEVTLNITQKSFCKPLYHIEKWCLVSKINSSISTVHFNFKKSIEP